MYFKCLTVSCAVLALSCLVTVTLYGLWCGHSEKFVKDLAGMSRDAGVPAGFHGCHLIKLNGYVFEGHLTSEIIKTFLAEKAGGASQADLRLRRRGQRRFRQPVCFGVGEHSKSLGHL